MFSEQIEAWLQASSESVTGKPGCYVPPGQDWCPHCGDTNYEEPTRLCLSCAYPDDPCSFNAFADHDRAKREAGGGPAGPPG